MDAVYASTFAAEYARQRGLGRTPQEAQAGAAFEAEEAAVLACRSFNPDQLSRAAMRT